MKRNLHTEYEKQIRPDREQFKLKVNELYQQIDHEIALLFIVYYCSLGVYMTEYVSSWIKRAGLRCQEMNLPTLGTALVKHAKEEEKHDILLHNDTVALTQLINKRFKLNMDESFFLSQPLSQGVLHYRTLHEECIEGNTPYGQIAIEYEIEKVSINHGPKFIYKCVQQYGFDLIKCLSFIRSHIKLDILHTRHNKKMLSDFLKDHPEGLATTIHYGAKALQCYSEYLEDCMQLAKNNKNRLCT